MQVSYVVGEFVFRDVVEELFADLKWVPNDMHFGFASRVDLRLRGGNEVAAFTSGNFPAAASTAAPPSE